MPTTTAPAPAPVAATPAAPVPAPATPAAAAATPAPVTPKPADPKVGSAKAEGTPANRLFQRLKDNAPQQKEEGQFPADKAPKVEKPAEPAAPAKAPEPEKPIKVSKAKAAKRPDLPVAQTPPPAVPPAPAASTPAPSKNWEENLLDEERAALEDARFAEENFPEHRGLADRMGRFFKEHQEFLEKNPDVEDDDPAYKKVLALKPDISVADRRRIINARAAQEVKKGIEPELNDLRHELYVRDEEPRIRQEGDRLFSELAENALPEEMRKIYKEKGLAELQKNYADEMEVAGTIIRAATDDAEELLRITRVNPKTGRPLAKIAENPSDPKFVQHERLAKIVDDVCDEFLKTGTERELLREGKWFVTREEWGRLQPAERSKFWTFTNSEKDIKEVIDRAKRWIPNAIDTAIKTRQQEFERRGWRRHREVAPAPAPSTPPQPVSSVSTPRPAPVPSPSAPATTPETRGMSLAKRLQNAG